MKISSSTRSHVEKQYIYGKYYEINYKKDVYKVNEL